MIITDYDIKGNPIYKQELIRYRAKLDEDDRRALLAAEKKKKQDLIKSIIAIIGWSIIIPIIWFGIIKSMEMWI